AGIASLYVDPASHHSAAPFALTQRRGFATLRGVRFTFLVVFLLAASSALAKNAHIVVYDGWGTPAAFTVSGRVLGDKGEEAPTKADNGAKNLVENLKALE